MEITEPVQLVPTNEPEVEREEACCYSFLTVKITLRSRQAIGIPEPVRLVPTNEPEVDRKEACSTARANERARSQEEGGLLLHFF